MELGNFLGKLKKLERVEPKKFLALILTDEVVQAAVWSVISGVTEIVALGMPVEWDGDTGTTTELITAVDATISSAVEGLGDEPSNVILGIPHSWTDKNGILGVKREFISKIRKELDLEPIGYVVITDSILSYLKIQEGTPTTSILIQVSRDELTLVLVKLGRIEAAETIGRSEDVVDDVTEGIARFKVADNLPSRIILFNSMHNLDDIIQNLLSVDWQTQFNFLHFPKIESLAKDVTIRALVVAGGSEVAKSLGLAMSDSVSEQDLAPSGSDLGGDSSTEAPFTPGVKGSHTPGVLENSESTEIDPSDFNLELLTAEEIGFTTSVVGADYHPPVSPTKIDFIDPDDEPIEPVGATLAVAREVPPVKSKAAFIMPKLKMPKISLPKFKLNLGAAKPLWWILGGSLIGIGMLVFYFVWILPSAVVTIHVTPKILEENVELTLSSTDSSIDFAGRVVPASIESVSETGEKLIETTGKKTIGDLAKGNVTIYNRTSAAKTFAKGTSLAFGSLKFTLDGDVSVASKSAGSDYVDVPGKANVSIVAAAIGTDYNIPSGTEFTIASFSKDSYVGKNDEGLTGGTSQEVQVVGKDDQKNLVKALTEELFLALTTKSTQNSLPGTGIYLIPDSTVVDSAIYSAKVGETAKTLTLSLTIKASLLKYKTEDVTTLVNSSIDSAVPSGYLRSDLPSTVDLSANTLGDNGDSVKGNAKVKVALLPIVDKTSLQTSLRGKSPKVLASILSSVVPGYLSAEVKISPAWIPARLKGTPQNPSHITVQVTGAL